MSGWFWRLMERDGVYASPLASVLVVVSLLVPLIAGVLVFATTPVLGVAVSVVWLLLWANYMGAFQ